MIEVEMAEGEECEKGDPIGLGPDGKGRVMRARPALAGVEDMTLRAIVAELVGYEQAGERPSRQRLRELREMLGRKVLASADCGAAIRFVNEHFQEDMRSGRFYPGQEPADALMILLGELLALRAVSAAAGGLKQRRQALEQAIRAITVEAPDGPNGPGGAHLLAYALDPKNHFACEAQRLAVARNAAAQMADHTRRLRLAAEAYFGGDFEKPAPPGSTS